MTKQTGQKARKKYNHVYPQSTYKHRADLIETNYIKGVYNDQGEQVMRPLNEEELAFLDKFYKETVHLSFSSNDITKQLVKDIRKLRGKYSAWKRKKDNKDQINVELEALIEAKVNLFKEESEKLGNFYTDFDSQGIVRSDSYKSKNCIYNIKKINSKLDSIDAQEYTESDNDGVTYIEDLITSSEKD